MRPYNFQDHPLARALRERVLVLDGATGTMQQALGARRGGLPRRAFADHHASLRGNGDILSLTRPDAVEQIHRAYLAAGADIIETNTFTATRIAQADYGLEDAVRDMNRESAIIARRAADAFAGPRWVAGVLGPHQPCREHLAGRKRSGCPERLFRRARGSLPAKPRKRSSLAAWI